MKTPNRKIKNATPTLYNGIQFKSKLEVSCYKTLIEHGLMPLYEQRTFTIWQGFRPSVPFYNRDRKTKDICLDNHKLRDITYTPDFTLTHNGTLVILEIKGAFNDVFPIKRKLFRKHLETVGNAVYFEIHTKRELLNAIGIIKNLNNDNKP